MTRTFSLPRRGVILILLIAALALSACQGGQGGQVAGTGGLQAWLDQPPDGSSIPLAAFTLKAHARDIGGPGVQQITFYVNDIPLATLSTDPTLPLVYAETSWNPAAPGLYTIAAEASNGTSTVMSVESHVCVGDSCEGVAVAEVTQVTPAESPTASNTPEPGVTPSATNIPTLTNTPTRTPTAAATCNLAQPQPTTPSNGDAVNTPTPTLSWTYPRGDCQPTSYRIDLCSDETCANIVGGGATGTSATSWSPAEPVKDCSIYYWRVGAINGSTFGAYSQIFHFATAFPGGCGGEVDDTGPSIRVANKPSLTFYGDVGGTCPNNQHLLTINMDVRDESGIASIQFIYRYSNAQLTAASQWLTGTVTPSGDNTWQTIINHNATNAAQNQLSGTNGIFEFQISAADNAGNQQNFNDTTMVIQYCGKP